MKLGTTAGSGAAVDAGVVTGKGAAVVGAVVSAADAVVTALELPVDGELLQAAANIPAAAPYTQNVRMRHCATVAANQPWAALRVRPCQYQPDTIHATRFGTRRIVDDALARTRPSVSSNRPSA